jgi:hypothetical protein
VYEEDQRGWEDLDGAICQAHITDEFLSAAAGEPTDYECTVCGRTAASEEAPFAVAWAAVLEPFMAAFWREFTRASEAPIFDHEPVGLEDTSWAVTYMTQKAFDRLDEIIPAITGVIADDSVGTVGALMTADHLSHTWANFSHTVKHEIRFVFAGSEGPAASVRNFLELIGNYATDVGGLITEVPVSTDLYRARTVFGRIYPGRMDLPTSAVDLGPAPSEKAGANRMSPAGVTMFYAAADESTALNEIAAYNVAEYAVVGTFRPARPLRMLNLQANASEFDLSPFDEEHLELRGLLMFFAEFRTHISAAITPDGREHVEYVPTQILSEYFRHAVTPRLDGIIFASSHRGVNYVVFATGENVVDDDAAAADATTSNLFDVALEPETLLVLDRSTLVLRGLRHRAEGAPIAALPYGRWVDARQR